MKEVNCTEPSPSVGIPWVNVLHLLLRPQETQHNDIQFNDTQHNETQSNGSVVMLSVFNAEYRLRWMSLLQTPYQLSTLCDRPLYARLGQTLVRQTKTGPSFQLCKWLYEYLALTTQFSKTAKLWVQNSAQTVFRFSPIR
jgi:hypothetical protein